VVTLMVTPAEAERITLAQAEGQIMLALRNPLDAEQTMTAGISAAALLDAPGNASPPATPTPSAPRVPRRAPEPERAAAPAPPPPPEPWRVKLIRGGKLEEETLE
jgi:pilus assembly protein CpaB